jgi:hypothetical protein
VFIGARTVTRVEFRRRDGIVRDIEGLTARVAPAEAAIDMLELRIVDRRCTAGSPANHRSLEAHNID